MQIYSCCEECGGKFKEPDNQPPGFKRFCSANCRARLHYRKNRDAIREREFNRYHSDPEYRNAQIARDAENKKRRRRNKPPTASETLSS